ncbi:uncharacterized protein LOC135470500 [Liolophura sinensis]|uniref:uncharacterized protein LOC135470500 n=1 Tax=Liolophura sinensis TaxID=3198878 RepID=UPI003157F7B4
MGEDNRPVPRLVARLAVWLSMLLIMEVLNTEATQYQYKRYPFRKKKDDKLYRSRRVKCDETLDVCKGLSGLQHTKCVRQCMSETCYQQLYGQDELEEGEIDVRLNSFKGLPCPEQAIGESLYMASAPPSYGSFHVINLSYTWDQRGLTISRFVSIGWIPRQEIQIRSRQQTAKYLP